jgi:hypothetical protein
VLPLGDGALSTAPVRFSLEMRGEGPYLELAALGERHSKQVSDAKLTGGRQALLRSS